MDDRNYYNDPWMSGVYETGRTRPPKRRGGCCAAFLVVFIVFFGISSMLSYLDVRLFAQLEDQIPENEDIALYVNTGNDSQTDTTVTSTEPSLPQTTEAGTSLELHNSGASVENIPTEGGLSLQEIYVKNIPSVVSITCRLSGGSASGTGVVLSSDGYIVTNAHVVEGANAISVLLSDGREMDAALVGADTASDLAVLYIQAADLTPAEFGDSSVLRVGDTVAAIGDPLGIELRGTLTDGIVSSISRDITIEGRTMTLIQTNAAINSGNSGGPLINCYGQVIGINTMKIGVFSNNSGVESISFAIPSTTVKVIVDQLISQGYVSGRPSLGLNGRALSSFYQSYFHLPSGFYIEEVAEGSPAAEKGIEPGDILVSIDGTQVSSASDMDTVLYHYEVGDTVTIVIVRSNRYYQVTLELIEAKG